MKKVAIVILNYKNWNDTIECLESAVRLRYPFVQLIVVDNASGNESVEMIREWASGNRKVDPEFERVVSSLLGERKRKIENVTEFEDSELDNLKSKDVGNDDLILIKSNENRGFSGGNNLGARLAYELGFDFVILLNNDTWFADVNFVQKMLYVFETYENVGLAGPMIINFNNTFDSPLRGDDPVSEMGLDFFKKKIFTWLCDQPTSVDIKKAISSSPVEVEKISGACLMLPTRVLHEVGYLDEDLWLSSEEAALARAVRESGYSIFYQPWTLLLHKKASAPRGLSFVGIKKNAIVQREKYLIKYKVFSGKSIFMVKVVNRLRLFITYIKEKII